MKLLERFRAWLNRDTVAAVDVLLGAISDLSSKVIQQGTHNRDVAQGIIRLANACESLDRNLSDRMDLLEGRLDEMKPKEQESGAASVPGHRPWTQRRDERWGKHFSVTEFANKLQKVGTDG